MMWGRRVSWFRGVGRLVLVSVFSMTIDKLNTNLLRKSKLNILASWSSKLGDALLGGDGGVLNLWDSDALLLCEVLAADSWERDWLVDTGLDWLRVGNLNSWLNNSHNRDIVASLLGNLLAVVVSVTVSVSTMSITFRCWLAHSHHLHFAFFSEANFNSLGVSSLNSLLVRVGADLVINFLNALGTDCTSNWVALFFVNYFLDSKLYRAAHCFKSRCTHFSRFNNIMH